MIVSAKHLGISKEVVSQKDGKLYQIHGFIDNRGSVYEIPFEDGKFPVQSEYYVNSYKGKDGQWHSGLVSFQK